jgi:amino acid transporter
MLEPLDRAILTSAIAATLLVMAMLVITRYVKRRSKTPDRKASRLAQWMMFALIVGAALFAIVMWYRIQSSFS